MSLKTVGARRPTWHISESSYASYFLILTSALILCWLPVSTTAWVEWTAKDMSPTGLSRILTLKIPSYRSARIFCITLPSLIMTWLVRIPQYSKYELSLISSALILDYIIIFATIITHCLNISPTKLILILTV